MVDVRALLLAALRDGELDGPTLAARTSVGHDVAESALRELLLSRLVDDRERGGPRLVRAPFADRLFRLADGVAEGLDGLAGMPTGEPSPGPWKAILTGNKCNVDVLGADGDIVAGVYGNTESEANANALLVATAPEMLALLKADDMVDPQTSGFGEAWFKRVDAFVRRMGYDGNGKRLPVVDRG